MDHFPSRFPEGESGTDKNDQTAQSPIEHAKGFPFEMKNRTSPFRKPSKASKLPGASPSRHLSMAKALGTFHLSVAVVLVAVTGLLVHSWLGKRIGDMQEAHVHHLMEDVNHSIESFLDGWATILKSSSTRFFVSPRMEAGDVVQGDPDGFPERLLAGKGESRWALLDREGRILRSGSPLPPSSGREEPWMASLVEGRADRHVDFIRREGRYYWRVAVPAASGQGPAAVLVAELPVEAIDKDGYISRQLENSLLEMVFEGTVVASFGSRVEAPAREFPSSCSRLTLRYRWDRTPLEKSRRTLLLKAVAGLAGIMGAAFGALFLLNRRLFVRPVEELRALARSLDAGLPPSPAPTGHRIAEIALLAEDLNRMAARIASREGKLKATLDDLENRVKERTARLQEQLAEQRRMEDALREREEKYRTIFESINDVYMEASIAEGRIAEVSPSVERLFGYSREEVVGKSPEIFYENPEDGKRLLEALEKRGYVNDYEASLKGASNKVHTCSLSVKLLRDDEGAPLKIVGTVRDITERKHQEEAMAQARREAESANRAKSQFLANMSHEIRTPLNGIMGFGELLASMIEDPRQRDYLEAIQSSGRHLLNLIDDILDLSKIDAGKLEIQYGPVDLRRLVDEVLAIFRLEAIKKSLRLDVAFDHSIPPFVRSSESRLRQILFNLVGNAVKFTDCGRVRVQWKASKGEAEGTVDLLLSVEDEGIGIEKDRLELIFQSFRQQDGEINRKYGGTGLGLTITRRLVEMMNGSVSVDSAPGEGSRFDVLLRGVEVCRREETELERAEAEKVERGEFLGQTVLVVDDDPFSRKLVSQFLAREQLNVVEATGGRQGVLLARKHLPDVILMDLVMPSMDGRQAVRELRKTPSTAPIPVVALTASVLEEDGASSSEDPAVFDGRLNKPFRKTDLVSELSRHLKVSRKEAGERDSPEGWGEDEDWRPQIPAQGPSLAQVLEEEMLPLWKEVDEVIEMDSIEDFARKLESVSRRFGISGLTRYAERLTDCARNFNIAQVELALEEFPRLLERIRATLSHGTAEDL